MSDKITAIKIFISCPSDVDKEKDIVIEACKIVSSMLEKRNIIVLPIHWRKDVPATITGEGPQKIIDKYIDDSNYDIYFGILWKKFGKPLENGLTPTENEFENALTRYNKDKKPLITFFFKEKEFFPQSAYETEQFLSVQKFCERIKCLGLYIPFKESLECQGQAIKVIYEFINRITKIEDSKISFTRIKYDKVPNYVNRKVCPKNKYKQKLAYFTFDKDNIDILELLDKENRIVIIGDAGVGKTIELQRIASRYSEDNSEYFPIIIKLNKYVNQTIEDLLPPKWDTIPENQLLLILDGLDEIESKNTRDAIRNVELFSERHPSAVIIVSCRSNFYQSSAVTDIGTLKDFKEFIIMPIENSQIDSYIKTNLSMEANDFENNIKKNKLNDLLDIPFYLSALVNLYRSRKKFPNNKASLFENFISSKLEWDVEHYRTTIELADERSLIISTLEKIALCAETLGRNYITDDELKKLLPDANIRNLIKYCSLINKSEGDATTWQFEHNNVQEFLAAEILSRQNFEIVKSFISFAPEYRKVIPSWVNTLSFLLTISPEQKLTDWILDIEPEITIKFEPDKIDISVRRMIFKNIFNNYKEKKIWIDRDKFRYSELARFGQDPEIIDFLIKEANNSKHYTTLSNAIEIMARMKIPPHYSGILTDLLTSVALDNFIIKVPEHVRQDALMAISDLKYDAKVTINRIVAELKNSKSDWIRYGLYYLLHNSQYLDENIDIFIEGIKYARFYLHDMSNRRSRLSKERFELIEGLKKAASKDSIRKILNHFIANIHDIRDLFIGNHDITFIAMNTAKVYKEYPEILDLVLSFTLHLLENHHEEAKQFEIFFEQTDARFDSFNIVMEKDSHAKEMLLADLADHQCLKYYMEQYEKDIVSEKDVWCLLNTIRWRNKNVFDLFYKSLNEKYAGKFEIKPQPDWDKIRNERSQKDFDLLFNKDSFIKEIKIIFNQERKESFTPDELLKLRSDDWPQERYSVLVTNTLREIAIDSSITVQQAFEKINQDDWWTWFAIKNIYDKLKNNEQLTVTEEQKKYISEWCFSNLSKVDFKKAITKTDVTSYSIRWNAIFIWYFYQRFDLQFPKETLLDMLSFDLERKGIEYLEKALSIKDISERILKNLENGIEINDVLRNHIEYCTNHNIVEVLPFAYKEIKNAATDYEIRHVALEAIIKVDKELTGLEDALNDINDSFKWDVVDKLIDRTSKRIYDYLKILFQKGIVEDKIKASGYLIKLQDINALEYYVEWIKEKNRFDREVYNASPLSSLTTVNAIPYIIELLKLTYQKTFQQQDYFYKIDNLILAAFRSISLESEDNYQIVKQEIEKFIKKYINVYENVNWLFSFLDQLEQQYFINKSQKLTIDDVINKIEKII
jgi:predicted NACHT family NTPase